jgi:hypothetical protein
VSIAGIIVFKWGCFLLGRKFCVEMAAASCDWVISHSDRPCYVVCAEDIQFVYLCRGYVSATDVLRAHVYAILMRVDCLECVLVCSLYAFWRIRFHFNFRVSFLRLVPLVCAKVHICMERIIVTIPFPCFVSAVRHFPSLQTARCISVRNRNRHFVDPVSLLMSLLVPLSWWSSCSPYATVDLSSLILLACAVFDCRSWDCDPWSPCAAKYYRYSRDRRWRLAVVNLEARCCKYLVLRLLRVLLAYDLR